MDGFGGVRMVGRWIQGGSVRDWRVELQLPYSCKTTTSKQNLKSFHDGTTVRGFVANK